MHHLSFLKKNIFLRKCFFCFKITIFFRTISKIFTSSYSAKKSSFSLALHFLSLSLSLSHTHTHTNILSFMLCQSKFYKFNLDHHNDMQKIFPHNGIKLKFMRIFLFHSSFVFCCISSLFSKGLSYKIK